MKRAYQEFETYRESDQHLPQWEDTLLSVPQPPSHAQNPFREFRNLASPGKNRIPLDQILAAHDAAVARLVEGYKHLVGEEAEDGLFQPDGDTIVRIYESAEKIAHQIACEPGDIETFCVRAAQGEDSDFYLAGPLGLYISALCNTSSAPEIDLDLSGPDMRIPLLGYRLPKNHTLTIHGHLNDLIGISLEGGHLVVNGNVGRYLGAGMAGGKIDVHGDAGRFIGEQMIDGSIYIHGRIGGIGQPLGGEIHHRKRRIHPPQAQT